MVLFFMRIAGVKFRSEMLCSAFKQRSWSYKKKNKKEIQQKVRCKMTLEVISESVVTITGSFVVANKIPRL